jgi:hypothetical protein
MPVRNNRDFNYSPPYSPELTLGPTACRAMIITGIISQKEGDSLRARKKEGTNCFHDIKI